MFTIKRENMSANSHRTIAIICGDSDCYYVGVRAYFWERQKLRI